MKAIGSSFDRKHQEDSPAVFGLNDTEARGFAHQFLDTLTVQTTKPRSVDGPW